MRERGASKATNTVKRGRAGRRQNMHTSQARGLWGLPPGSAAQLAYSRAVVSGAVGAGGASNLKLLLVSASRDRDGHGGRPSGVAGRALRRVGGRAIAARALQGRRVERQGGGGW